MIRKHVYYSGNVQGVGFRFTTVRIAANYDINGYVKNMYDGRVEVVVEGEESEVDEFLQDLAESMSRNITAVQIQDEPYEGRLNGFDISF